MSNEDKFQNLQFIKLDFTLDDYDEYEGHLVAENFKKYLIAKCPNLKNALQMETKEVHGIGYIDYCFESK